MSFRDDVRDVGSVAREFAGRGRFKLDHVREHTGRGFTAHVPPAFLDDLAADPRVKLIEPDGFITLNLPRETARPGGGGGGQQVSYGVARVGGSFDGTGRTAWIIDSGIDLDHPDLNTSRSCHVNFVTQGATSPDDGNGHGTHVAGIVAAKDNAIGTSAWRRTHTSAQCVS